MNKSKNNKKAKKVGVAAAYVAMGGSSARQARVDSGTDVVVSQVLGNANYTALAYAINPGLEGQFAALAQEAKRYDRYEFLELSFHFVGTTVISTTVGQIGMAFEPNPNTGAPSTQAKFTAYESHAASSVYKPDGLTLRVPKSMLAGARFVRQGPRGGDMSLYDPGLLIVMVRDEASANPIGYIEVHYKVRFSNFHLEPTTAPVPVYMSSFERTTSQTLATATPTTWLGLTIDNSINGLGLAQSGINIALQPGCYSVRAYMCVTDDANEVFTATIALFQNSAVVTSANQSFLTGVAALSAYNIAVEAVMSASVVFNMSVVVTLTGAAGTLSIDPLSRLFIEAL
jgi:hypothetical protein